MLTILIFLFFNSCKVKIGANIPLTGPVASYGKYCLEGIKLKADMSPEIELVVDDNEADPNNVTLILKKFAAESVKVVIGPLISPNAVVAGIEGKKLGITIILPAATNSALTKVSPLLFRTCFTDKQQGEAIAEFLYSTLDKKELQIVADTGNIYSSSLALYVRHKFAKLGGKTELIPMGNKTEADSLIEKFTFNTVFLPLYYESVKPIIVKSREKGLNITFVGADGWDAPELFDAIKDDSMPAYFSTHYFMNNNNVAREFDSLYMEKYNKCPNTFVALGFDAMNIIVDALKSTKSLSSADIHKALLSIKEFQGVTGTFRYNGKADPQKDVFIVKLQSGKTSLFTKIPASESKVNK
ncbi:MAG: ABC transporter substrate-binding protein [bacterium]|nr:ABC transporter substrate-binding protein [bacterium]